MTEPTFLWHDYETFGADPRRDRPCQFAAIRTDAHLEPVGEPVVHYCQPTSDVLPHPDACMITGITPQIARERGDPEYVFAEAVMTLMTEPGTCAVGYNNFRFDDEVTRFLFWRNFIDPYGREFRNGNSRFDLIDLLRMTHALRPEGMHWYHDDEGRPGFRLEDLARVNGFAVDRAHDALADVENTLELARLVRHRQPRLWAWALSLRDRRQVEKPVRAGRPFLHASSRYPASECCIAPVLPLFRHPRITSQWLVWNLRVSPAGFEDADPEELADLHFTPARDLPEGLQRLPVKWLRVNRSPMIAPMGVLDAAARERTGIDLEWANAHAARLRRRRDFLDRLATVFDRAPVHVAADAETALYDGFVPDADRRLADRIRRDGPERAADRLAAGRPGFSDERLAELLLHWVGRHAPDALDAPLREAWERYRRKRLIDDPDLATIRLDEYRARLQQLRAAHPDRQTLIDALELWPAELGLPPSG